MTVTYQSIVPLCGLLSIHCMCLASIRVHLGTLLVNNLQLLPVSADGLCAFQVMHYATLTPARVLSGVGLSGRAWQEAREVLQAHLSEDR